MLGGLKGKRGELNATERRREEGGTTSTDGFGQKNRFWGGEKPSKPLGAAGGGGNGKKSG